jgi:phosphatidylglycerol:prolipoprotein diacylglycerol transferase
MIVGIDPIVVSIGPVAVRWFGLLALAGFGLGVWLSLRGLARQRLARRAPLNAVAWALPAGLLVAHLVHVLGWWDYYFTHASEIWQLNLDSLSLWGGLLGALAIGSARLSRDPPRRRRIFDVLAPNIALGIAVGRVGAFLDGHGQGLPTDLPWATQYASRLAATPDFGVARHPAQLYDAVIALVVCGVLLALPRGLPAGSQMAMFFVVYGAARLALGAVRLDPSFLFGLQIDQLLAIGGIAFGAVYGLRPLFGMRRGRVARARGQPRPSEESVAA